MFFGDHFLANPPFLTKSGRMFNVYEFGFPETATSVYNFPRSFFVSSSGVTTSSWTSNSDSCSSRCNTIFVLQKLSKFVYFFY